MTQTVLMAIGPDRPGLVEVLSQFVFEHGGNIETSRMVNLGGYFGLMLMIRSPAEAVGAMAEHLHGLSERTGLRVDLLPVRREQEVQGGAYRLIARGVDRAGMLHQLSFLLRTLGVNIDSADTHVTRTGEEQSARRPGGPGQADGAAIPPGEGHFEMELGLTVPEHVPTSKLREYLGHLWSGQSVSWELVAAWRGSDDPSL